MESSHKMFKRFADPSITAVPVRRTGDNSYARLQPLTGQEAAQVELQAMGQLKLSSLLRRALIPFGVYKHNLYNLRLVYIDACSGNVLEVAADRLTHRPWFRNAALNLKDYMAGAPPVTDFRKLDFAVPDFFSTLENILSTITPSVFYGPEHETTTMCCKNSGAAIVLSMFSLLLKLPQATSCASDFTTQHSGACIQVFRNSVLTLSELILINHTDIQRACACIGLSVHFDQSVYGTLYPLGVIKHQVFESGTTSYRICFLDRHCCYHVGNLKTGAITKLLSSANELLLVNAKDLTGLRDDSPACSAESRQWTSGTRQSLWGAIDCVLETLVLQSMGACLRDGGLTEITNLLSCRFLNALRNPPLYHRTAASQQEILTAESTNKNEQDPLPTSEDDAAYVEPVAKRTRSRPS